MTGTSLSPAARLRVDVTEWALANGGIGELAGRTGVPVTVIRAFLAGERDRVDPVAEYLRREGDPS